MNIDETREGSIAYGSITSEDIPIQNDIKPWYKKKNNIFLGISIFLACFFGTLLIVDLSRDKNKLQPQLDENHVCMTPKCASEATRILKNMNTNIDPCDDFYEFACGNYMKKNIPDSDIQVSVMSDIDNNYRNEIRNVIEKNRFFKGSPHVLAYKTFYNNCMNRGQIEKDGLEPILRILKNIGGWPVIEGDSWQQNQFHWIDTISNFTKIGFLANYLFDFEMNYNYTDTSEMLYHIDQPEFGLSDKYLVNGFNEKYVTAYYDYIVDIAVIFGADRSRAQKEIKTMMEFQINLANSLVPAEKQRNISLFNNPMTLKELEKNYGNIAWSEYHRKVIGLSRPLEANDFVIVSTPSYFKKLNDLITITDNRTLANFIFWRSVESVIKYLPNKVREAELNYRNIREGITEHKPRWIECVDTSLEVIEAPILSLYYQSVFNKSVVEPTKKLVLDIHAQLLEVIKKNEWMDAATKKRAINKAKAIKLRVALEHLVHSQDELEAKYKDLELMPNSNYLESFLIISRYSQPSKYEYIRNLLYSWIELSGNPVNGPALLNPTYNTVTNEIDIPAGILTAPFMDIDRPQYLNFATVGFVVGHELIHCFDDIGSQFDRFGNLNNWWDVKTKEQFVSKSNCLVYQYGNYTSKDVNEKLNGIVSLGENMADNGAVKVMHLAYEKWVKDHGAEKTLPALDYTPKQLFWINTAQIWCSKYRPQTLREIIVTDQHSPEEFRIKGAFSNSHEFAEDFQCPVGSKMNPEKKCSIW